MGTWLPTGRPLRVIYLAPPARQSGRLSRYGFLDEEIRALAKRGVDAFVLTSHEGDHDEGAVHLRHIPADSWGERAKAATFLWPLIRRTSSPGLSGIPRRYRAIRAERVAAQMVATEQADLIHSFFGWPGGSGGTMAKLTTGVPLIAALRGADVNTFPAADYGSRLDPGFDRALRQLLRTADLTVSNSQFTRRQALSLGARPQDAVVVHKGVRLDVFDAVERRGPSTDSHERPIILAVSGLVPIKGLTHVLDALAILRAEGLDFEFVVCGDGPDDLRLRNHAASSGLAACTRFLGRVSRAEIASVFAAADILVHGSLMEAAGNVLLEAMAARLPVVCTDAGGPSEYVVDQVTGFVVPVADPPAMADRVKRLLKSQDARASMGTNGRRRVEEFFAYDAMISKTLELYERVISQAKQPKTRY